MSYGEQGNGGGGGDSYMHTYKFTALETSVERPSCAVRNFNSHYLNTNTW